MPVYNYLPTYLYEKSTSRCVTRTGVDKRRDPAKLDNLDTPIRRGRGSWRRGAVALGAIAPGAIALGVGEQRWACPAVNEAVEVHRLALVELGDCGDTEGHTKETARALIDRYGDLGLLP